MSEQKIPMEEICPISGRPMRELREEYRKKGFIQIVRDLTKHRIRNGKLVRWEPVGGQIEPISEEERKRIDEELEKQGVENPYTTSKTR